MRVVMFAAETDKAVKAMHNRFFAGRRIQAQLYDSELYVKNDLSG